MTRRLPAFAALVLFLWSASAYAGDTSADLMVRSARLDLARPRNTFGYNVVVANTGPGAAHNAELLVLLPPGTGVRNGEECVAANGGAPAGLLRCKLGTLAVGEERRVFVLLVSPEPHPRVTAIAVSDTPDPDAANNVR